MSLSFLKSRKKVSVVLLLLSLFLINCNKQAGTVTPPSPETKFFAMSSHTDADVRNFANEIKKRNDTENFLQKFISSNGYILWDDAEKAISPQGVFAILPFIKDGAGIINGFVIARHDLQSNAMTFQVFNKDLLLKYGFDETARIFTARKVQSLINYFNYRKFNTSKFNISDIRQIPADVRIKNPAYLDNLFGKFRIGQEKASISYITTRGYYCFSYWDETDIWWDPDGDNDACHCSGNETYAYTISSYQEFCVNGGGGEGGDIGNPGDPGNPGGGGPGGGGGSPVPGVSDEAMTDEAVMEDIANADFVDPTLVQTRPLFVNVKNHTLPASPFYEWADVALKIGSEVQTALNANHNTCATRVSYALNYGGSPIPSRSYTFDGTDNKHYILGAQTMLNYLKQTYGTSTTNTIHMTGTTSRPLTEVAIKARMAGKQGIYVIIPMDTSVDGFNASGHVDILDANGVMSSGHEYYWTDGGVKEVYLFILP